MAETLRKLLIQRAARLQARPALTAPDWGTLSHGAWRNRVEGLALGLLSESRPIGTPVFSQRGDAWDWALEVAAACAGLRWEDAESGTRLDPELFGGARFNDEDGRRPYHDREDEITDATPFHRHVTQGALMLRLQRGNRALGWDHDTVLRVPMSALPTPEGRAALWNLLYAGGHAVLETSLTSESKGFAARLFHRTAAPAWDPVPFKCFWD